MNINHLLNLTISGKLCHTIHQKKDFCQGYSLSQSLRQYLKDIVFVFPIVPWFPYSKRKRKAQRQQTKKKQMSMLHTFTAISINRLLMFWYCKESFFFFGLAQCIRNLYTAKEIPTGKSTIKIAQIFCISFCTNH